MQFSDLIEALREDDGITISVDGNPGLLQKLELDFPSSEHIEDNDNFPELDCFRVTEEIGVTVKLPEGTLRVASKPEELETMEALPVRSGNLNIRRTETREFWGVLWPPENDKTGLTLYFGENRFMVLWL